MNDSGREYLPTSGNGYANGNGNGKIFNLVRAEDRTNLAAPEARRRICRNGKITHGARMFFCYVIDMALTFGSASKRGVYRESDGDLATQLKVSARTIHNWKKEIASTGEVWITQKRMKNTLPETVYNFTCIIGQAPLPINADSEDGSAPQDDVFTSNRKRSAMIRHDHSNGRFICRLHGVSGCAICRSIRNTQGVQTAEPISSKTEQNQPVRKIFPSTEEENFRPEQKEFAVHHGNRLPQSTEKPFRPPRKISSVVHGKTVPQSTENSFRGPPKQTADNIETRDKSLRDLKGGEEPDPPEKEFQDWLKTLDGMWPSRLQVMERNLTAEWKKAKSPEARAIWQKRLAAVRMKQLGGPVEDKPKAAQSVRVLKPTISFERRQAAWEKAKAEAGLTAKQANQQARIAAAAKHEQAVKDFQKPKAAAKAAART